MNDECVHDPVNRVCYGFEPRGEDLVVHVRLDPGGALPQHLHPAMEERWSVIEGEVRFRLNGYERVLRAADGEVVVRPGVVHGLSSMGNGEARLRCLVTPAMRLQDFLEESAAAAREGVFTARGLPRGLRGARWSARFLKRYRSETVFVSPPPLFQKVLIALLAREGKEPR
jgi:quercetin dioxygenase-like cupin family protein